MNTWGITMNNLNFKLWMENDDKYQNYSQFKKYFQYRAPDSLIEVDNGLTFTFNIENETLYLSQNEIFHFDLKRYLRRKLKVYVKDQNIIDGRIGVVDELIIINYYGYNATKEEILKNIPIIATTIHNTNYFPNLNYYFITNEYFQKINVEKSQSFNYKFIDKNLILKKETDNKDNDPSCPEIDFQNLMTKLHTGTSEEKNNIALRICNMKINQIKCPIVAKQVEELKARCNCKKQIDYKKEYETLLANAKRRELW